MTRKIGIIVIKLVKDSAEKPNKEIEEEIQKELRKREIPWMEKVDKVTVLESAV